MARSEAQKRADKKYMEENTKLLQARVKIEEEKVISDYCKKMGISKARFIFWACNDFIKRGELPPESEVVPLDWEDSE